VIFLTTGTFGFAGLIEAVDGLIAKKVIQEEVVAQIGHSKYVPKHAEYFRTSTDVKKYMRQARYVISHGGTGSMLELLQMGKKIIAVANRDLSGNHQEAFLLKLHGDGTILYADAPEERALIEQIAKIDAFQPAVFSFYPPSFIEMLRRDLSQSGGASESRF
jgi:UDP-N-acetylglucosamine transferase subunit ALG13